MDFKHTITVDKAVITIIGFSSRPGILREDLDAGKEHIAIRNIYNSPA